MQVNHLWLQLQTLLTVLLSDQLILKVQQFLSR